MKLFKYLPAGTETVLFIDVEAAIQPRQSWCLKKLLLNQYNLTLDHKTTVLHKKPAAALSVDSQLN